MSDSGFLPSWWWRPYGEQLKQLKQPTTPKQPAPTEDYPYLYRWDREGRKGQACRMTARGTMNSCTVEFEDGHVMVTSRNALARKRPAA